MKELKIFSVVVFTIALISCSADSEKAKKSGSHAEILEIYDVKVEGESYEKGSLTYKEHKEFRGEHEFGTVYYNVDGSEKGKAILVYEDDPKHPVGFQYFDAQDSLLVFYQYTYNDKEEQAAQHAFDVANKELLRIERYAYDEKGNRTVKEVRNAKDEVMQRFNFTYDGYGNETSMLVESSSGSPISLYTYKIMAYNEEKQWTEKWGFVNDKPKTYHKITRR